MTMMMRQRPTTKLTTTTMEKLQQIAVVSLAVFVISSSCWYDSPLFLLPGCQATSPSFGASSRRSPPPTGQPLSFSKKVKRHLAHAKEMATLEQAVEDANADFVATCSSSEEANSHRKLICLPLTEDFNPSMGTFGHNHIQTSDKVSLPKVFQKVIMANQREVPWMFTISRCDELCLEKERVTDVPDSLAAKPLEELVGTPLDCRAPPNYVFLPHWMFRSLGLHPLDVVTVKYASSSGKTKSKVAPGTMAKFRPHKDDFIEEIDNHQAVLETELKYYSSLTRGSTIAFDYNGKRYWFDVEVLLSAPKGEPKPMVKTQDCDLATDFLPSRQKVAERLQKRKEAEEKRKREEEE